MSTLTSTAASCGVCKWGKLQSSGDNQQWIEEEERRGESPSAAIQFNCLMSGHQETFQLITSAVAVSSIHGLVSRVRPALINTATASVHRTALLATLDMYLCLGKEFAGEDYISNGDGVPSQRHFNQQIPV